MKVEGLKELRIRLLNDLGLNFTENREDELYKKLSVASNDFGFKNTDKFIQWIINTELSPIQIEKLATFLTIGETYFLREIKALNYLENIYLPKLINERKGKNQRIRIWSAGCASGEEPYSIAILLRRIIPDIKNWNICIMATDINANFLEKARKGIYTKWSFRRLPDSFKKQYFTELEKDKFQIHSEIQKMVSFSYLNLATNSYPSLTTYTNALDIILCRNVLIYFSENGIKQVSSRMYDSLIKGGVFLLSPVEVSNLISDKFHKQAYNGYTIYVKETLKSKINGVSKPNISEVKNTVLDKLPINDETDYDKIGNTKKAKNEEVTYNKAMVLFEQGKFEETEVLLKNALYSNNEIEKENHELLIKTEANLGKLANALTLCEKALLKNKLNAKVYYLKAIIQQEQGNVNEAMETFKKVIYIEPDFTLAHFSIGNLCYQQGMKNAGNKHYKNTLQILAKQNPDDIIIESEGLTVGRLLETIKAFAK